MGWTVPIRPSAEPAWVALQHALTDTVPPCEDRVEWISHDREDIAYAIRRCQQCAVMDLCGQYADAAKERSNVWGGKDRSPRQGRPETLPLFQTTTKEQTA